MAWDLDIREATRVYMGALEKFERRPKIKVVRFVDNLIMAIIARYPGESDVFLIKAFDAAIKALYLKYLYSHHGFECWMPDGYLYEKAKEKIAKMSAEKRAEKLKE